MNTKIEKNVNGNQNNVTNVVVIKPTKGKSKTEYPAGCIGADLMRRNYVRYLVERYHRFKEADGSFLASKPLAGKAKAKAAPRFSYAVIYKNIEAKFKAPTYFIPVERFPDLVDYLQGRVDQTILGKRNRSRGQATYSTFDEYQFEQLTAETTAT
jgi:hypothetical protein